MTSAGGMMLHQLPCSPSPFDHAPHTQRRFLSPRPCLPAAAQYAHLAAFRGRVLCRGGAQGWVGVTQLQGRRGRQAPATLVLPAVQEATRPPPSHQVQVLSPWPPLAAPLPSPAGDSETGSVSSGGGSNVEFLPVHPNLAKPMFYA